MFGGGGLLADQAGRWVVGGSPDDGHDEGEEGSIRSSVCPLASSATCVPQRGHTADPSAR